MHQERRRDRRPARRAGPGRGRRRAAAWVAVEGGPADVVIVGFFSGRQKDFAALMASAERELTARGVRVVGRIAQRRGVSGGGAGKMHLPYSSRTLLSSGKVRELAALRERTAADAAVFLRSLTEHQREVLSETLGCPVVTLAEVLVAG